MGDIGPEQEGVSTSREKTEDDPSPQWGWVPGGWCSGEKRKSKLDSYFLSKTQNPEAINGDIDRHA